MKIHSKNLIESQYKGIQKNLASTLLIPKSIIFFILLMLCCFNDTAVNAENNKRTYLPAPYKFPKTINPWKLESVLGIKFEKPILTKKCKAEYKQPLAPWLPIKTELLTVILGRSPQFSPANKFRLLVPGHPEGSKNHLIALMDSKKLVFAVTKDKLKIIRSFKSINYPGYIIRRVGENFIFSDLNKRIEYTFFSKDSGFSWFVKNIRKIDNRNICLDLIYNDHDKVTAVVLPDKKRFILEYKNGFPEKIISPYALISVLKWNELSFISSIKTYLLPEHPLHPDFKNKKKRRKKPYLIRYIKKIEHDSEGSLIGFINTYGDKFSIEYRHDEDKEAKTAYWCAILTPPSGKVSYCSKKHNYSTKNSLFEKGNVSTAKDGTEQFNSIYSENRSKKAGVITFSDKLIGGVKYTYKRDLSTTAITSIKTAGKTIKKIDYDTDGATIGVKSVNNPSEKLQFNANKKIVTKTIDSVVEAFKYKDEKLISIEVKDSLGKKNSIVTTYQYDDDKTFKAILPNGSFYQFKLDDLFRLVKYVTPKGKETHWKYILGTNTPYEFKKVSGVGDMQESTITEYLFTPQGLLTKIKYPDNNTEVFKYKDGNIDSYRNKDKTVTRFKYNQKRQRVLKTEKRKKQTRYIYNKDALITKLLFNNDKSITYKYDRNGKLIKRTAKDGTWEAYAYHQNGKKAKIRYSDRRVKYLSKDK